MLTIRPERPEDYEQIYDLVKCAFALAEHSDGDEQDLVLRLRKSTAYIPELALVAEKDGTIAGHIMFTKLKAVETMQLCLAPLAVAPEFQNQGIGAALINAGHQIANTLGYELSVLIGYPAYYARFGYQNAAKFGLKAPMELPDDVFMAVNLQGKDTCLDATVEFAREFFEK